MRRAVLHLVAAATLTMWAGVVYLLIDVLRSAGEGGFVLPTLAVLPSLTPSPTPGYSPAFREDLPTAIQPTHGALPLETPIPHAPPVEVTSAPTLSERLLSIYAVMPGVDVPATPTPFPAEITVIPAPPNPFEPLAEATRVGPPYWGWYSFESDHPAVVYATRWEPRLHPFASRGQYHRTEDVASGVRFAFEGEGLRIRYVAARNIGRFEILVDGIVLDTIDAYASELSFPGTQVYTLAPGAHTLILRSAGTKHPASDGYAVALDAVQVWRADAHTLVVPPLPPSPALPEPIPAQVQLNSGPPSPEPTATPGAPQQLTAALVIGYDENGNRAVDPAEGVSGIPVRVVEVESNRLLASAMTDSAGYVEISYEATGPARLVVPYFGRVWNIPRTRDGITTFSLVLPAGNQPGLVP